MAKLVNLPVLPVPDPKKKPPQAKAIVPLPKTPPPKPPSLPEHGGKLSIPDSKFSRVASIKEISRTAWRDELLPARFDNCFFHVESGSRESGRRIVVHEFPKRDLPYSEDMGRIAISFSVRAYCIVYPRDVDPSDPTMPLYLRDYRIARNILQERLDTGGAGTLQLPTFRPVRCVCQKYRMQEEERFGGYVTFDIQFVEMGAPPFRAVEDTEENMLRRSRELKESVIAKLARPHTPASALPTPQRGARPNPVALGFSAVPLLTKS